ncbi:MAG TPA: SgcJ/EcaC family oxidoreductase [Rhodopila sp.]|uniref:SgcJ/EcaC family oxidoreductase n=1 Tax=Rhodopila sp. TaxID=2480087 RepID=UPI002BA4BF58|nr:SgcJ/EcaC family oxidoreductase [Rhodopila sp.]HVY13594.1 SgcJ/EcaC family oxidoreductase [Rhodopila sp.]
MSSEFSDTIEQFLDRFRAAWDAGDARAYAAQFTEDATYVTWRGDPLVGREAIERMHDEVFTRWSPGSKMRVSAVKAKTLGSNSCVVLTAGGLVENSPPDFDKMQTFALVQSDGRWLCAAFQNTAMSEQAKSAYNSAADKSASS